MKQRNKNLLLALGCALGISLASGSVFAAYAITDHAEPFSVRIAAGELEKKTITYHFPDSSDSSYAAFLSATTEVSVGSSLSDASISMDPFLGFAFVGWYSDASFTTLIDASTIIDDDIEIYAKYSRDNVHYYYNDSHNYYYQSAPSGDITFTQSKYYVGTQVFGIAGVGDTNPGVSLGSDTGVYRFQYDAGTWNCLRKVGVSKQDVSWWTNDGAYTRIYAWMTSDTSKNEWTGNLAYDGNNAYAYVDAKYDGFIVGRVNPSASSSNPWDNLWNQTEDILLSKDSETGTYSSTNTLIYVSNSPESGSKKGYWGS